MKICDKCGSTELVDKTSDDRLLCYQCWLKWIEMPPIQPIVFTKEYERAIKMVDAFKKHIWEDGHHGMSSIFNRADGSGHLYCHTCKKLLWDDGEELPKKDQAPQ